MNDEEEDEEIIGAGVKEKVTRDRDYSFDL